MRITVTVDDDLVRLARQDVKAGRDSSLSAWVARAMEERAQARRELRADLDRMRAEHPPTLEDLEEMARVLGRSYEWVWEGLGRPESAAKKPARAKRPRAPKKASDVRG